MKHTSQMACAPCAMVITDPGEVRDAVEMFGHGIPDELWSELGA